MTKAYVVAEIKVTNPQGYPEYLPLSTASVAQYGGQWKVRGGTREQKEGEDDQHNSGWRTVIIEFPSMEQARGWYDSVEYTKAKAVRQTNSVGRLFIVDGAE
ncbi:MAG: D-fructose-6-phosphate amidotransferase [Herminiimonas sp.]|nr:D-fructose-6-phosphate amidotransferase [Herminiimonas sp.]